MTLKVIKRGYLSEGQKVIDANDVYKVMCFLGKEDREKFYVLHLDAKNRIIAKELVSVGTLTNSLSHPREIFKGAILNNSASIILVHNHPSGDTSPSKEDIERTKRLIDAGNLIGIGILDHIIVGYNTYTSMMEKKICFSPDGAQKKLQFEDYLDRAVGALIKTHEKLKKEETLNKNSIRTFSRALRKITYDIFCFRGVVPEALGECYRMYECTITKKQVKA